MIGKLFPLQPANVSRVRGSYALLAWLAGLALLISLLSSPAAPTRPSILWLTAEDMSPNLGCYGDAYAITPNLDAFARQAVRYTRAFATAPVCSPSRSCLVTGMYATSLGTQRLRSQFPVPSEVRGFPAYLRAAGYYCANNVKTDYNVRDEAAFVRDAWDESSPKANWRGRKPGQPFFVVHNFMTTHQSRTSAWSEEEFEREIGATLSQSERHDPARANLPPFYPDTIGARRAWARYHDCITAMDKQVGDKLAQLAADGLADDTIVFFYSDHGMGMPRGKRTLYDSGLSVPLLVRFPEKWKHLAPMAPGGTTDRLVSFVDFAPTVLALAGMKAPKYFQGAAFLGAKTKPHEFVFGARDRVDEAFDVARSVRDGRWLYIRNFMPHLPWMQPEAYSDTSVFRQELKSMASEGTLRDGARSYAGERAREELYDTEADPHQLRNLAASEPPQLDRMRRALRQWQLDTRDAGFLTEPEMWERIGATGTPRALTADAKNYPLREILHTTDLAHGRLNMSELLKRLRHPDSAVRYWTVVGVRAASERGAPAIPALLVAVERDSSSVVRIEAAGTLLALGETEPALATLRRELKHAMPEVRLHAARTLELAGAKARPLLAELRALRSEAEGRDGDAWMFLRFTLDTTLRNLPAP